MNRSVVREIVVHGVIATAVVIGAYVFLVEPQQNALRRLDAEVARLESTARRASSDCDSDQLATTLKRVRGVAREVRDKNAFARDRAQLYDFVSELAASHGVEMGPFSPQPAQTGPDAEQLVHLRISAVGSYEQVVRFVDELTDGPGFTRIDDVLIRPVGEHDEPQVRATISTVFVAFPPNAELAAIVEE
jgi:Tfp pilus assembly protein PilO